MIVGDHVILDPATALTDTGLGGRDANLGLPADSRGDPLSASGRTAEVGATAKAISADDQGPALFLPLERDGCDLPLSRWFKIYIVLEADEPPAFRPRIRGERNFPTTVNLEKLDPPVTSTLPATTHACADKLGSDGLRIRPKYIA